MLLLALLAAAGLAVGAQPVELGDVRWERDFAAAEARARATGKPLFALFQEIPGCQTCVSFGERVLKHPLLVEAIESEFVPVAVYNNRSGADRAVLERFGEPAWNNPVVRLLAPGARDLLPRADGVYEPHAVGARMIRALEAAKRPVPRYLSDAVDELTPRANEYATFAMHCFWRGEACLGEIPGLLASRAGFLGGREVVELSFDPAQLSYSELIRQVRRRGCADAVLAHDAEQLEAATAVFGRRAERAPGIARSARDSDQKRDLRGTPYARLSLTPRQALRVNAAVAAGRSPEALLSPRQRRAVSLPRS